MIFSTERVSANNKESFLFIGFLLISPSLPADMYGRKAHIHFCFSRSRTYIIVGLKMDLKKSMLLDFILIITSVVPPEIPTDSSTWL